MTIDRTTVEDFLHARDGHLVRRESQTLEFKENFNLSGLADYFRIFAAFANNRGGYIIFGVTDSPRRPLGLSSPYLERFNNIDPRRITEPLLEMFVPNVHWEQDLIEVGGKRFGVFYVHESAEKPVIARKNQGKVRDGEIYYRYRGQTQKIRHAELAQIISQRVETSNDKWRALLRDIGRIDINHATIVDTARSVAAYDDAKMLVVDEDLGRRLGVPGGQYIVREGTDAPEGDVPGGAAHQKVVVTIPEKLTELYPYAAMDMADKVQQRASTADRNRVWKVIRDHDLKDDPRYSSYNFRNKAQEETYRESGTLPVATPSIYNPAAVDLIVSIVQEEDGKGDN